MEIMKMVEAGELTKAQTTFPPYADKPGWLIVTQWMPNMARIITIRNEKAKI